MPCEEIIGNYRSPCTCQSHVDKIDRKDNDIDAVLIDESCVDVVVVAVNGRQHHSTLSRRTGDRETSSTDGYWGWIVVVGCFFAQALTIGSTYTFGIVFVEFLEEFGHSRAVTSWIGSIQTALLYMTGRRLIYCSVSLRG